MHLQQTKRESAKSGGPQYYFHDLSAVVKTYLRSEGAVPVALVTPYGATKTAFMAVSKDHKLDDAGKPVAGNVGHDRIQQPQATGSIGEEIRRWYDLPSGQFERIDVEIEIADDAFYVRPTICKYAGKPRRKALQKVPSPLTFTRDYMSPFWIRQIESVGKADNGLLSWLITEICRIAKDHRRGSRLPHIQEVDILRASGALNHLGLAMGGYVGKGYDCSLSEFSFLHYPAYQVPVEIKRDSDGFRYQQKIYAKTDLSRAVILCANHNHTAIPANIDIIELEAFHKFGRESLKLEL